ncbi:cytochrome c oxidase subunit 4 [Conexibacter sp. SYSU D00693]|uniref:cytochrome c oxidase subunit 4 n=1 Tax=Conexibacter sp. SYSU D00693 TaxID=2812560 RepID=UPI00196B5DC0|nr:cytochrome c oxidase subunit 4 [Conexibacter sp. SYSU D00693]
MSPVDPQVPPAGEEIHLPGLSAQPLLVAVGTTILLIGVTFNWFVFAFGVIMTTWVIINWVRESNADIAELPVHDEGHH